MKRMNDFSRYRKINDGLMNGLLILNTITEIVSLKQRLNMIQHCNREKYLKLKAAWQFIMQNSNICFTVTIDRKIMPDRFNNS